MGISRMKDDLHARLWAAQQRWFAMKDRGLTKHDLKMQGIRERGDMFYATRGIIFTGSTRLAYEQVSAVASNPATGGRVKTSQAFGP